MRSSYEEKIQAEVLDDIRIGEQGYKYRLLDGLPVSPFITPGKYHLSRTLQTRPSDVCYVSFPRSGSTWLSYILLLIVRQGILPKNQTLRDNIYWVTSSWPRSYNRDQLDAFSLPRIFKNHMPYHMALGGKPVDGPCKYIYLARNPKAVMVSYYYFERGKPWTGYYSGSWEHWFKMFVTGQLQRGDWFNHVLSWWEHRDTDNILFLKYEELKRVFDLNVKQIADFLGYPLSSELLDKIREKTSFQNMKKDPFSNLHESREFNNAFWRGKVDSWKLQFTVAQNEQFDALYAERMRDSGLTFDMDAG